MPTFLRVENYQSIKKLNKKSDTISIQKPLFRDQEPKVLEYWALNFRQQKWLEVERKSGDCNNRSKGL